MDGQSWSTMHVTKSETVVILNEEPVSCGAKRRRSCLSAARGFVRRRARPGYPPATMRNVAKERQHCRRLAFGHPGLALPLLSMRRDGFGVARLERRGTR